MINKLWKIFVGGALGLSLFSAPAWAVPTPITLVNPGFTYGLSDWAVSGRTGIGKTTLYQGHKAFKMGGLTSDGVSLNQYHQLQGGQSYVVTGYFARTGRVGGFAEIFASLPSQSTLLGSVKQNVSNLGANYQPLALTFNAPATGNYRLSFGEAFDPGHVFFRGVLPAPEVDPVNSALPTALAAGALLMIADRRKREAPKAG